MDSQTLDWLVTQPTEKIVEVLMGAGRISWKTEDQEAVAQVIERLRKLARPEAPDAIHQTKPEVCSKCGNPFPHALSQCLSLSRSRAALPANIRKTLEDNLPVEVATAIADYIAELAFERDTLSVRPEAGAIRTAALEEAASLCDQEADLSVDMYRRIREALATRIRELKSPQPQREEP